MKSTSVRRAIVPGLAAIALGLSGCAAGNEASGAEADSGLSGTLNGGGSSAQEAAQAAWRAGFQQANGGVTVNYDPVGSGTGRENFISKAYAFAGSDSYLSTDEGELDGAKQRCGGEDPIEVPAYVSPIAVVFNVPGVDSLDLTPELIARIFDGKVTTWDDPAIASLNDGVDLPDTAITPVHRSDDSGTTANFTDYLAKAAGGAWPHDADSIWPIKGGESAEGTSGLVGAVSDGEGAIGYADESQAGGLGIAAIKVGSEFNAPTAEGAAKVVAVSPSVEGRSDVDMAVDIDRSTTESGAYPLVLLSYLIACQHYDDAGQAALVKGFASYVVSEDGQQAAAGAAGSAPLDAAVQQKAAAIVEKISAN